MTETVRYDVSDGVATVTLNRPDAMNALNTELKMALRDTLGAGCRGSRGARRAAHRHRPRVLRRPGPRGARPEPAGRPRTPSGPTVARALHADRHGAGDHAQAGRGRGQRRGRRSRRGVRVRLRLPDRRRHGGLQPWPSPRCGLSADSGSSWTLPRLVGMAKAKELLLLPAVIPAARRARARPGHRGGAGASEVASRARALAVRLAAGPTVAYGAIRRSLAFSAGHGLEESLGFERQMMELTGEHRGPSRRRDLLPRQGPADLRGALRCPRRRTSRRSRGCTRRWTRTTARRWRPATHRRRPSPIPCSSTCRTASRRTCGGCWSAARGT